LAPHNNSVKTFVMARAAPVPGSGKDVDVCGLFGKPTDLSRIAKVGGEEASLAAGLFNLLDGLRAALDVAPMHDHLETVGGQLQGDRTANTGRRPGHKRL
jgi:hypothetical protein